MIRTRASQTLGIMPGAVSEGPTVSLSCMSSSKALNVPNEILVANNFWGKDDAGVHPMLDRMHNAKVTCDELKSFYNGEPLVL